MIAPIRRRFHRKSCPAWHAAFLAMLPKICSYAQHAFCHWNAEAREDAIRRAIWTPPAATEYKRVSSCQERSQPSTNAANRAGPTLGASAAFS